jgi:hypothetical protein
VTVPMKNGQATEVTLPDGDQRAGRYTVTAIYRKPDASVPDTMALTRFRDAEGLDSGDVEPVDVPPDQEDDELRYLGIWRAFLGMPDDS